MEHNRVLIVGSGHLAYRVKKLAESKGYETIHIPEDAIVLKNGNESAFDKLAAVLKEIDLSSLKRAYLLDDRDDHNLELMIALMSIDENLPITATLFNENITPHLQAAHPNLTIYNPAKIAAPVFVDALSKPVERFLRYLPSKKHEEVQHVSRSSNLLTFLLVSFVTVIILATIYFHVFENLSLLNSLYFVIATVATVGYGDINLLTASSLSKIVDILLILSSTFFIWMIFSLTIDRIIKKRVQRALGRKKYSYKNHVILCGLGRLGYFIAEELIRRGETFIIIEIDEHSPNSDYFRSQGIDVYTGNASFPNVLKDVGVARSKAVISAINNDYANLEIGLNARSFQPDLRLILRIFDQTMAEKIKENLDIHLTLSVSAIADDTILNG